MLCDSDKGRFFGGVIIDLFAGGENAAKVATLVCGVALWRCGVCCLIKGIE